MALEHADIPTIRPRAEHAQIMDLKDVARLEKGGDMLGWPWKRSDRKYLTPVCKISDVCTRGPGRIRGLYAFRSVIDAGARTTLGTDFPVEGVRPTLVTHPMDVGLLPEQMMTRLGALRGMSIDPTYASFTENILGSIEPGTRAKPAVLSQCIVEVPAEEILKAEVLATVMDGVVVYRKV